MNKENLSQLKKITIMVLWAHTKKMKARTYCHHNGVMRVKGHETCVIAMLCCVGQGPQDYCRSM